MLAVGCHYFTSLLWLVLDRVAVALTQTRIWLFDPIHRPL
jgi:hypothetical protein